MTVSTLAKDVAVSPSEPRQSLIGLDRDELAARLRPLGVPERQVILRHALPHAIGPVAQVVAMQLAWLAGGIVVIEVLFRYPGIGQAMVDAVNNRDVQVVQTISLLIAAFYVVVNLLADVVGILANPKLRTESGR